MKMNPFKGIYNRIIRYLMKAKEPSPSMQLSDFDRLSYEIRACDVILISGRSRVSNVIKTITQSHWSHAALYIGRLHDIESDIHRKLVANHYQGLASEQLVIETEIGKGTVITPLSFYKYDHMRICRPDGLHRADAQKVINFAIERLGHDYNVRQIIDLARFLFPWNLIPRRWRSSLFSHNAGTPTREVCSTLIATAFAHVDFPLLPMVRASRQHKKVEFIRRNPRLFTPSDFDFSPYFNIIKYPLLQVGGQGLYRHIPWNKELIYSDDHKGTMTTGIAKNIIDLPDEALKKHKKKIAKDKSSQATPAIFPKKTKPDPLLKNNGDINSEDKKPKGD